jgi:hypothetical protein
MSARRKQILPESLYENLLDYVINENFPTELNDISSQTIIRDLCDIEFSKVTHQGSETRIKGTATIEVQLNYAGGSQRDGVTSDDSYPMTFNVVVDENGDIQSGKISVDISSFYE